MSLTFVLDTHDQLGYTFVTWTFYLPVAHMQYILTLLHQICYVYSGICISLKLQIVFSLFCHLY